MSTQYDWGELVDVDSDERYDVLVITEGSDVRPLERDFIDEAAALRNADEEAFEHVWDLVRLLRERTHLEGIEA